MTSMSRADGRPAPRGGRRHHTIAVGTVVCCALVLAGCSSAGPDPAAPATPVDELEAYVEAVFAGLDVEAQARLEQDFIAGCMNDLGFDYIPTLAGQSSHQFTEGDPAEIEVYRLAEGWGVTAESTGTGMERPGTTESVVHDEVDPNVEILDALSEVAAKEWVTTSMDCSSKAMASVSIEGVLAAQPELAQLHAEIMELRDDESAPQWLALDARWAQCMTDRGYPGYTAPSLARLDFHRAHAEVPPVVAEEIEEQRAVEVATAAADLDCRSELDYDVQVAGFRDERATAFLAEHKAEMDEMLVLLQEALPRLPDDDAATP